ncbi:glycolate oxidase subunit GlcE [Ferribacterium limneticum]|uniref:glycolate oxidase subunit GlcE n=1 Tax=Ferribacterium limneticum TaxID=76259 RepID=UPI001CFA9BE5|nr:glycolate oxidase subunit GlcE [Ferribacterium limneticum]UCV29333.1 glycolate oxidase subunit GlcE [Ferribacterium limneticum]UCV33252.1 glycolate oxidase subunit GlcE [Ferribacterium limneticum]
MTLDKIVLAVRSAHASHTPLRIRGAGSKDFYGGLLAGDLLDVSGYRGITAYEPTELYMTARCGTPLSEIEAVLAEKGQMLAFEPPQFSGATAGGCVAAGLSGPRRQQAGAVRDFVLGVKLVDGSGQVLKFGGQVMKNVAGYDVSRLIAGSLGTLGVIAEVTLKVLPKPVAEQTLVFALDQTEALKKLNHWGGQPLPISASFWHQGQLWLRLSGAGAAVEAACRKLGGTSAVNSDQHWHSVREQAHPAFASDVLWRLALPSTAPCPGLDGLRAIEWGGALRWYAGEQAAIRGAAARLGGHAVLYRAPESLRCLEGAFAPLSPALLALHRRLKKAFDPKGILNPGRLYAEF